MSYESYLCKRLHFPLEHDSCARTERSSNLFRVIPNGIKIHDPWYDDEFMTCDKLVQYLVSLRLHCCAYIWYWCHTLDLYMFKLLAVSGEFFSIGFYFPRLVQWTNEQIRTFERYSTNGSSVKQIFAVNTKIARVPVHTAQFIGNHLIHSTTRYSPSEHINWIQNRKISVH